MGEEEYKKIFNYSKKRYQNGNDDRHDLGHIQRMVKNVDEAVRIVGGVLDPYLVKSMVCLHDLPIQNEPSGIRRYFFESHIVREKMPGILNELGVTGKERKLVFNAVVDHPLSIPWRRLNRSKNLYTQVLQDLDSLDFFSEKRLGLWEKKYGRGVLGDFRVRLGRVLFHWGKAHIILFLNQKQLGKLI